jgi:hypothetical protein
VVKKWRKISAKNCVRPHESVNSRASDNGRGDNGVHDVISISDDESDKVEAGEIELLCEWPSVPAPVPIKQVSILRFSVSSK